MSDHRPDRDDLLPLKSAWFHILLSLADGPVHGYAIRADVEERTDGRVTLWPATLYGSIDEMAKEGLIVETDPPPEDEDADTRRKYYRLTPAGRNVLAAEADRLDALVEAARRSRALRKA